jgi:4-amino-4-deoxy-L-arabinose transferase-like glycosyltransferase
MSGSSALDLLSQRAIFMIVSVLTIILFLLGNLPWQLEDYDQAKQAFSSWQIVRSGRFLYQQTPGGKVATKPPLVGWASAIAYDVSRSWDLAWRLPSLASALLLAWLLWRSAAALFGNLAGLMALSAFSLNLFTPRLATLVRTDMPLALATFLIGLLFFERICLGQSWKRRQRAELFLLLTASMLIKGPIVYAFILPPLAWFGWRYRKDAIVRSVATGWWPWFFSLAIFIIWVVGGIKTVPGFYNEVVLKEFVGRFGETFHRPQPLYFYIPHLLHKWAPWNLLLIALLVVDVEAG